MRILRIDLFAFGTFSNARLDFSHKPDALQLVYGPNEAGKSTTLRALLALLYGIPVRTPDAHLHDMTRLRIGATLLDDSGTQLSVVRRKGLKQTLLDAEGQPLPEGSLRPLLGGLDEALFRNMFGLDHERLRQGAEALLAGGGSVGEGLFEASVGSRALRELKEALSREAEELYKPRGKTPKLNLALEALKEKSRRKREAALSPSAFVEQQRALAQKRQQRAQAQAERRAALAEQERLRRVLQLLPLLARHEAISAQLGALRGQGSQGVATGEPGLLGSELLDEQIRELERRYGVAISGEAELPQLRSELAALQRELSGLRARLGQGSAPTRAIDTPARARLRKLLADQQRESERARSLREALRELERDAQRWSEEARALRPAQDTSSLAMLVSALEQEQLPATLARTESELTKRQGVLTRALAQLGLPPGLESLAGLSLPEERTLLELEQQLSGVASALAAAEQRLGQLQERKRQLLTQKSALLARGELASPLQLEAARNQRDVHVDELAQVCLTGRVRGDAAETVRSVRQAIVHSDQLADRLRREAREASELQRLEGELGLVSDEQATLGERLTQLQGQRTQLTHQVEQLAQSCGLPVCSLGELRSRVLKLVSLREATAQLLAERDAQALLLERAQLRVAQLTEQLTVLVVSPPTQLDQLLALARGQLATYDERRREAEARASRAREALARAEGVRRQLAEAEQAQEALGARFGQESRSLGFAPELGPDELFACLDDMARCFELEGKLSALREREQALVAHAQALQHEVAQLASKVLPELSGAELSAQLEGLARAQRGRREAARDEERLARELAQLEKELFKVGDGESVASLKQRAHAQEPSELRARLVELEASLASLDDELSRLEQELGGLQVGLATISEAPHAVQAAEEVEAELGNVRGLLRRYLEVRLSLAILGREVERYRREHQGPLMTRASQLFARLTLRNYTGLDVEFDERDEPVLCALHKSQRRLRVAGLSDGTRDQLYLALRIATIEHFLSSSRVLPLVLDDAFIHFDDARAEAALTVLGELSKRTQVLFFTHHARMIELAKRALKPPQVALHELDPVRGTVSYRDDGPLFARL